MSYVFIFLKMIVGGGLTTYLLNEARLADDLSLFKLREIKARENNVKIGGKKRDRIEVYKGWKIIVSTR